MASRGGLLGYSAGDLNRAPARPTEQVHDSSSADLASGSVHAQCAAPPPTGDDRYVACFVQVYQLGSWIIEHLRYKFRGWIG